MDRVGTVINNITVLKRAKNEYMASGYFKTRQIIMNLEILDGRPGSNKQIIDETIGGSYGKHIWKNSVSENGYSEWPALLRSSQSQ